LSFICGFVSGFCGECDSVRLSKDQGPKRHYWSEPWQLCGKAFLGALIADPADDTTFKNKELEMHVRSCEGKRIRTPFFAGTDTSRTWLLTREEDGLLLKHEHRHQGRTPEKITQYGGRTKSRGLANRQVFPAGQQTVEMLPVADPGVWRIDVAPGDHFTYNFRELSSD
jgi:hypothetical protein